jgi:hypothetical protein
MAIKCRSSFCFYIAFKGYFYRRIFKEAYGFAISRQNPGSSTNQIKNKINKIFKLEGKMRQTFFKFVCYGLFLLVAFGVNVQAKEQSQLINDHLLQNSDDLLLLAEKMRTRPEVPREALSCTAETFRQQIDVVCTFDEIAAAAERVDAFYPNLSTLRRNKPGSNAFKRVLQKVQRDFPGLSQKQIMEKFLLIKELYRRARRHEVLQALRSYLNGDNVYQMDVPVRVDNLDVPMEDCDHYFDFVNLCKDEIDLILLFPEYVPYVDQAKEDAAAFDREYFGYQTNLTKSNCFRHALWNALMAKYISINESYISLVLSFAKSFADAHESCCPDNDDKVLDLHNNREGRDYFESVAEEKCSFTLFGLCFGKYIDSPSVETIKTDIFHKAMDGVYVKGETITEDNLEDKFAGSLVYTEPAPDDYTARILNGTAAGSDCPHSKVWFNYSTCGNWKIYPVTPGHWIRIYAYGDSCSGCVLYHIDFDIQEDLGSGWVTMESHNPPDTKGMVYTTVYRPSGYQIRILANNGFYIKVYELGVHNGGFETGSWASGWVVKSAQPYPSITSNTTYVANRGTYSLGNAGDGTYYSGYNGTYWGYGKDVVDFKVDSATKLYFDTYGDSYAPYAHYHVKVWFTNGQITTYDKSSETISSGWSLQLFQFPSGDYGKTVYKLEITFHKDHSSTSRRKPTIFLDNINIHK